MVERLPEIAEALVIGAEEADGGYWMPLFVVLAAGVRLDEALRDRVREAIRAGASPRPVPDEMIEVPAIPHTRTGKKLQVPVKRLLQGGCDGGRGEPGGCGRAGGWLSTSRGWGRESVRPRGLPEV